MNDMIKNHVESLFVEAPTTRRANELKDELVSNLTARYNDLISQGMDEDTACKTTIDGIGDVKELITSLREQEVFDPVQAQMQRKRSALLTSAAVALYIVSFVFPIFFSGAIVGGDYETPIGIIGVALMFVCWATATGLLVYNGVSKPRYLKEDDTIVEDFKEWKSDKNKKSAILKSIYSMVYMLATILFFILGVFFHAWHPGWLVFLLAPVVVQIIKLVSIYREGND